MKIGIVGCGLIGTKRALALGTGHQLVAVADSNIERAERLAKQFPDCEFFSDWRQVVDHRATEAIIVSTTNDMLTSVATAVVELNKPALIEKPAARNVREIESLMKRVGETRIPVKVGFNHRFHPAFIRAREIWDSGEPGELMYIRGRYGHGGRPGYDKEWRANPAISGGGELIDQGIHLIDLSRWFAGEFSSIAGSVSTYYWNMPVDDNAFMLLKTPHDRVAWLHVSCTEWKNLFSFEIFGRNGKLQIDGLGGSYGTERLTYFKMLPEMGPPETTAWEFPGPDRSWALEFDYFAECIRCGREPEGNLRDASEALSIVQTLYQSKE